MRVPFSQYSIRKTRRDNEWVIEIALIGKPTRGGGWRFTNETDAKMGYRIADAILHTMGLEHTNKDHEWWGDSGKLDS